MRGGEISMYHAYRGLILILEEEKKRTTVARNHHLDTLVEENVKCRGRCRLGDVCFVLRLAMQATARAHRSKKVEAHVSGRACPYLR